MKNTLAVSSPPNDLLLKLNLLIRLRWGGIFLLFILLSYSLAFWEQGALIYPLLFLLGLTLLFNIALHLDLRKRHTAKKIIKMLNLQFYFDIFFYLFIFHFTGGTGSPFFILLLFPAISATIVFQPPGSYFRAGATLLMFGLILYGETNWHMNPPFLMIISMKEKTILLFIALTGSLLLSVYLTANLVQHLRQRFKKLVALQENLKRSYFETVMGLAQAMEAKEPAIREHFERTILYATLIGKRLGLDDENMEYLRFGAVLHDIGKIGIAKNILTKPAKLTPEEHEQIKKHPGIGAHIINGVEFLKKVKPIILQHHERYDGKGYPQGLKGEEISFLARIMSVVDAYDAMTSDRPYAKAKSREKAIEELIREKGKQFDPGITDTFLEILREM